MTGEAESGPRALSPEAAFKALGNETRLTILDTLWRPLDGRPMGFAELRKAVGMRDGSQFNYHLRKLLDGGFIGKDDGKFYVRQPGARVVCTVRTGYLTEHPEIDPFETTGRCFACDGVLQARYTGEMFFVECAACGVLHSRGWFPPNALLERTPEEALLAHEHAMKAAIGLGAAGICPVCNGTTTRTLSRDMTEVPIQSSVLDPERDGALRAWHVCHHCGVWVTVSPGDAVREHPAVVELYRDHDIDILSCPRWELPWTIDPSAVELVSEDPFRARVTVAFQGDELVLTLDEEFEVVSTG